jgi:hypothetical protein
MAHELSSASLFLRAVGEYATIQAELEVVTGLMQRHISANALDKVEYQRQYDEYAARFEAARSRINEVNEQREALSLSAVGCKATG